jgi:hypothetical protein
MQGAWSGCFQGYRGEAIQDLGYELPRIHILGTWVNKDALASIVKAANGGEVHRGVASPVEQRSTATA